MSVLEIFKSGFLNKGFTAANNFLPWILCTDSLLDYFVDFTK